MQTGPGETHIQMGEGPIRAGPAPGPEKAAVSVPTISAWLPFVLAPSTTLRDSYTPELRTGRARHLQHHPVDKSRPSAGRQGVGLKTIRGNYIQGPRCLGLLL